MIIIIIIIIINWAGFVYARALGLTDIIIIILTTLIM